MNLAPINKSKNSKNCVLSSEFKNLLQQSTINPSLSHSKALNKKNFLTNSLKMANDNLNIYSTQNSLIDHTLFIKIQRISNIIPEIIRTEEAIKLFNKHSKNCATYGSLSMNEFVYLLRFIAFKMSQNKEAVDHVTDELQNIYRDIELQDCFKKIYFNEDVLKDINLDTHFLLNLYDTLPNEKKTIVKNVRHEELLKQEHDANNELKNSRNFFSNNFQNLNKIPC